MYHIHLDGIAVRPDLHFSFDSHDFGPSFIHRAGMPLKSTVLTLTNRGTKDMSIVCVSETSLANACFQFDFKQIILLAGKSHQAKVTFIPRECRRYDELIVLELNGLTTRTISLSGVGTHFKVELVDPKHKLFDVGTLQIGQKRTKDLKIVNRSVAAVDLNILFEPKSEYLTRYKQTICVEPSQNIHLQPGQILDLSIKFQPKQRIPRFSEDLYIDYRGLSLPICALQGACHGYNIWLDFSTISFGAIAQKCSATKRLIMHNEGDIGASFKWDLSNMQPEFSIWPVMGYISAGMEVNFDIKFNPSELVADLRKENVQCFVEGIKPLIVNLSGSCVQVVPQKEAHTFDTFVRQKEVKQISISNRTNVQWDLKPLIEGEYFSGLESFLVEPQSTMNYEVTYFPLTMCGPDGKKHSGSIFFPLPDGTGLLYNLTGNANPPKPVGKLNREVPCKQPFTELLTIENWLKKPQRFKVSFEVLKPEKPDPSTTIKGNDYIDVPGNSKKEYKLHYYSHKEGATLLRMVFKNEQTSEYGFYEIGFKSVKGGSVGTIDLITQVRVPISYSLKLDNPLTNMVTFNAVCASNTEVLIPTSLSIIGKGQGDFNFEFLPLKAGETSSKLELTSPDLGTCVYDLNLKAMPAASERPIHFKTSLGNSQTLTGKIINFCRTKTDYVCKVNEMICIHKTI